MLRRFVISLLATVGLATTAAANCGGERIVQAGDTILGLAAEAYGDPEKWTLIYYANQNKLTGNFAIAVGTRLMIPCAPGQEPKFDATPLQQVDAELKLVTGSNFAPFTDTAWPGQGMVTELINAAMEMTPEPVPYAIAWENDWSQHLSPILTEIKADMGFPWYRPDCAKDPGNFRCTSFHFSDPLVDVLIMLFVPANGGMQYVSDADVVGKTLCRPAGYFTHDLDRAGRDWLSTGLVRLVQPETPRDCFDLLMQGQVDAVALNVFTGAQTLDDMGLRGQVVPLETPLSAEGLHVVISKTHWRGTTHLYRINAGLRALRDSDRYNEIVSRHLGVFWDQIQTN
ncbi:MAG: transporter substrate-binding domain-containing protein [Marinovum sp.]|nr:transporter substrate-binding domain-containing protein [Marinovum sp.]